MRKKKKVLITVLAGIAVAIGLVVAFYAYKNINEKPPVVVEQQPDLSVNPDESSESQPVLSGEFKGADAVHMGEGTVKVIENNEGPVLSFDSNFSVTIGPDLFVYLSPNAAGEDLGEFASLGRLKSDTGEQAYNLPANYKNYKTVVIWCRAFSVTFATAELQ